MRWIVGPLLIPFLLVVAGCPADAPPEAEQEGDAPPAAMPEPEAAIEGYDPDTLPWVREGRPVEHGGRSWVPVGRPLYVPLDSLERVGEFEGTALFAPVGRPPPYEHLFFPYGGEFWQALEPLEAQNPRDTGEGGSEE